MMKRILPLIFLLAISASAQDTPLDAYHVIWDSPSPDHYGSMPLGNGDISLNVWVEPSGDLVFYMGKTDSWGDNSRLLKVGKVRVSLDPNPFEKTKVFRQTLNLKEGGIDIQLGESFLKVWVDANHPVAHITINSKDPVTATARIELWRTESLELPTIECSDIYLHRSRPDQKHGPTIVEPDTVLMNQKGRIGWYHHNKKSLGPDLTMKIQGLKGYGMEDPILHRTFGAMIVARDTTTRDDSTLVSTSHSIDIYTLTEQPATPEQWLKRMDQLIDATEKIPFTERRNAHLKWWKRFWSRSWIFASEEETKTPPLMTKNSHPIRIGLSQAQGERFMGEIGRVSIFNRALSDKEITALASDNKEALKSQPGLMGCFINVETGKTLDVEIADTLTLEAWIHPEKMPGCGGRIIDKTTPGGVDGFLLDTYPGNSLRLITRAGTLINKDILTPGQWRHVAAVIHREKGELSLYHNGKKVEGKKFEPENGASIVTRAYILQRFINACAGRGAFPIKFNGSIFTVPNAGSPGDADYRRWGPGYWWQNTRLPYLSMCASGDYDLMQPLFRMYAGPVFELCKYRTRHYFNHPGAYFPECIYFWGACFSETYGWTHFEEREDKLQTSGWHKWEWVCGPELACLMLDYYEHTQDEAFLKEKILPLAKEVMLFFENYYETDENGKLVMHPSQAVETWWECTNPMSEVAGLRAMSRRLLELPDALLSQEEKSYWGNARKKIPELPITERNGLTMLAPAEKYAQKRNIENPELYAVYPFRQIAIGNPNLELGLNAFKHRWDKGNFGWRQEEIFMAYLGLTQQARDNLVGRAKKKHSGSRFPAFWGPNYDWIPDQDHGGVLLEAFQSMLLQTDGKKIYLFPAWPKEWDVSFKLHAPYQTIIQGQVLKGKIKELKILPEERKKDLILLF